MLVRVDLEIVKYPPPVMGSSLDSLLISYFSLCLSDFPVVPSNSSSFLRIKFCTESKADSTVNVRNTMFIVLLPNMIKTVNR